MHFCSVATAAQTHGWITSYFSFFSVTLATRLHSKDNSERASGPGAPSVLITRLHLESQRSSTEVLRRGGMQMNGERVGKEGRFGDAIKASLFLLSLCSSSPSFSFLLPLPAKIHVLAFIPLRCLPHFTERGRALSLSRSVANTAASCSCIIHCCAVSNPLGCWS